jgi:hypothetical protein
VYPTKPYTPAVTLFGKDGSSREFSSKKAFFDTFGLSWIQDNVGENFKEFSHCERFYIDGGLFQYSVAKYKEWQFVLRSKDGSALKAGDFWIYRKSYGRKYIPHTWNGFGPVPGIGKRGLYSNYFRLLRTAGLRRDAQFIEGSDEPRIRAKRNSSNLRTTWDDVYRSDWNTKSWKNHRKTQWK